LPAGVNAVNRKLPFDEFPSMLVEIPRTLAENNNLDLEFDMSWHYFEIKEACSGQRCNGLASSCYG
jgi:hypothetical protein